MAMPSRARLMVAGEFRSIDAAVTRAYLLSRFAC
jgi:hypothetical protein